MKTQEELSMQLL